MKRLTTLSLIAVAAAAMIAVPVDAQTRGGSNSRGGSGGGNARNNGGTRPSSSISAPASQNRSAGQSGNTKGLSSASRSAQPSHSSAQPQRSRPQAQHQAPKSSSQPKAQPQQPSRERPQAQHQAPKSSSQPQQPSHERPQTQSRQRTHSQAPRSSNPAAKGGSDVRKPEPRRDAPRHGEPQAERRQHARQPGASANRNQPRPGSSARPNAPRRAEGGREPRHVRMRPDHRRDIDRIPPRHRDPMPHGRAVRFWDGGNHYFGYRVTYLPARRTRVVYAGVPYYLLDGIYYRYYGGYYYVSRPPFGIVVDAILDDIIYSACRFAYYYDVANTYRTINENAQTIASQNATIAANNATIARQNADIALNSELAAKSFQEADRLGLVQSYADAGVEYFYQDGVFFTKDKDGKYLTIVPPAGALVSELPDDYETITLDGEEYYKVDDTVFKLTIIDGAPYFEVLGQLTGSLAQKYDLYESL